MPVHDRIRAQAQLILNGHPSAATHPAPDRWDDIDDFDYFYREHAILVRAQDADEVTGGLTRILEAAGYGERGAGGPAGTGQPGPCPADRAGHADAGAGPRRPSRRGSRTGSGQARA